MKIKGLEFYNDDERKFIIEQIGHLIEYRKKDKDFEWCDSAFVGVRWVGDDQPLEIYRIIGEVKDWNTKKEKKK